MITFKEFILEAQEHTSADTSLNQISAGLKHAVAKGLITPKTINTDVGGGRYDVGKEHVEGSVKGATLHIYDPYNRSSDHNEKVQSIAGGKSNYVGLHNVLNVIKEPEARLDALRIVKSFMGKNGTAHITVHEGDKTGDARMSKSDRGRGSSWQNHLPTASYVPEVSAVFPEKEGFSVNRKGKHILVTRM